MLRLRQIALVARELAPVEREIREVLGLEVAFRDPMVATWGLENAVLPFGHQFLEVVAPTKPETAAGRHLDRRKGDGGYMVILQCDDPAPYRERAKKLGVRSAFEHEDHGYRIWQLHPRDTGGAFLEIDLQPGGEDWEGPWHPAGPSWQQAVRTDVVRAIAAAEIQSPDPAPLAARWAEILGRPVETRGDALEIRLDQATIRFVAERDGRGEGLGGFDVVATDRARLLGAAERLGGPTGGDSFDLGGVRIRVVDAPVTAA